MRLPRLPCCKWSTAFESFRSTQSLTATRFDAYSYVSLDIVQRADDTAAFVLIHLQLLSLSSRFYTNRGA